MTTLPAQAAIQPDRRGRRTLMTVGLGNIGSQLVDHLGRLPDVGRLILLDQDVYEESNLRTQKIDRGDVGRPKVEVQAERLRRQQPDLEIITLQEDLAQTPLGWFRADLVLAGLHDLEGRLQLGVACWRMGTSWLDGAIEPEMNLARVTGYRPGPDQPCLGCALEEEDYRLHLKPRHACGGGPGDAPATNGMPALGALTAALLALEASQVLSGATDGTLFGRQVVYDPIHQRHFLSTCPRNPNCHFDHQPWQVSLLKGASVNWPLGDLLKAAREAAGLGQQASWEVAETPLATHWRCPRCGHARQQVHLYNRLQKSQRTCPNCPGRELTAVGFEMLDSVHDGTPADILDLTGAQVGLREADVLTVRDGEACVHLEIERRKM